MKTSKKVLLVILAIIICVVTYVVVVGIYKTNQDKEKSAENNKKTE